MHGLCWDSLLRHVIPWTIFIMKSMRKVQRTPRRWRNMSLTDADYETISSAAAKAATSDAEKALANAVKTDKALNEFASAEKYVPSIIAKMLPSWGERFFR